MSEKNYQPLTVPGIEWNLSKMSSVFGELVVQPLEPGYGITFGNALRRTLLSSIEGAAVTSVIIKGVNNEFGNVNGLVEDVLHLLLNIKKIVIKSSTGSSKSSLRLKKSGLGVVVAGDIVADDDLEILNKDLILANLAED
jgi:DNA-directed RNA polymerase subunit alpha